MLKWIAALVMCAALSGCSATDALTGLIGSKPEISAQAGAENNKVGVGLTNKVDSSNSSEATVKDSKVGSLDSSSGKKTADNSIRASTITAERIEITNNDSFSIYEILALIGFPLLIIFNGCYVLYRANKKAS
ncbi:u-spanin [Escherichia phage AugustePiccard]|uniref:U-spanin n=1 Tax=Escherichia phage AugustePiccard TaxID=2851954 RepID=A0AAE7VP20_9CAUD|nr:u-spanin [Escherichia phage AugustePiccard]